MWCCFVQGQDLLVFLEGHTRRSASPGPGPGVGDLGAHPGHPGDAPLAGGWAALAGLAARAALVVTDESPVPPDAGWLDALAGGAPGGTAVWAVDAACTLPMRSVSRSAVDKAWKFRSASAAPRKARMAGCPYAAAAADCGSGVTDEPAQQQVRFCMQVYGSQLINISCVRTLSMRHDLECCKTAI